MNEQETTTDIIAWLRRPREGENGYLTAWRDEIADRLEAAHKREIDALKQRCAELNAEVAAKDEVIKRLNDAISEEQRRKMATAENSSAVGNAAKLREALSKSCAYFAVVLNTGMFNRIHLEALLNMANAALAAPPRNCDVGTPEEQSQRFDAFCDAHKYVGDDGANWCSRTCPCYNDINCGVNWAQMPYESEVTDGE